MEEKSHLPKSVINIWRIYGVIELVIFGLILIVLFISSLIWSWPLWVCGILLVIFVLYSPLRLMLFPKIRWEHFFYEIKGDEIDIQDGIFIIKRTLVPIVKIQKVYISQGPLLKKIT
ncbi:PH domain-containing protein [Bacillus coahuilensis]|uniref:PH domain-containing protein n=1 Tax=Bacillus coahuilensis TaxID=408580 RepID=UPI000185141B